MRGLLPNNVLQKGWTLDKKLNENTFPEPNSGCWLWGGYSNSKGYGLMYSYGITILSHRYSYECHNKVKLKKSDLVLHKCNNTYCVNPQHLTIGTQSENMQQCFREGRGGQFYNPQRKVAKLDVKTKETIDTYYSIMDASRKNSIAQSSISRVCMGKQKKANGFSWKYLD